MDTHGQVVFYGLMIAIVIIVVALALAAPVKEIVDSARANSTINPEGMDCTNSSISDFQKGACHTVDLTIFYFIGGLIFLAGIVIRARVTQ